MHGNCVLDLLDTCCPVCGTKIFGHAPGYRVFTYREAKREVHRLTKLKSEADSILRKAQEDRSQVVNMLREAKENRDDSILREGKEDVDSILREAQENVDSILRKAQEDMDQRQKFLFPLILLLVFLTVFGTYIMVCVYYDIDALKEICTVLEFIDTCACFYLGYYLSSYPTPIYVVHTVRYLWSRRAKVADTIRYLWSRRTKVADTSRYLWSRRTKVADTIRYLWSRCAKVADTIRYLWIRCPKVVDTIRYLWSESEVVNTIRYLWSRRAKVADTIRYLWSESEVVNVVRCWWSRRGRGGNRGTPISQDGNRGGKGGKRF